MQPTFPLTLQATSISILDWAGTLVRGTLLFLGLFKAAFYPIGAMLVGHSRGNLDLLRLASSIKSLMSTRQRISLALVMRWMF